MLLVVAVLFDVVFFDGNDFVFTVVFEVVVYFECIDFVVFAAGIDAAAVHTLLVDCVPVVVEIVVVAIVDEIVWSFLPVDKESNTVD